VGGARAIKETFEMLSGGQIWASIVSLDI